MTLTIWSFIPSDVECARALREVRWVAGLLCLYCGSSRVVRRGWRKHLYQRYCCKNCGRWFNDRTGTAMDHSRLPLRVWFFTAFMMHACMDEVYVTAGFKGKKGFRRRSRLRGLKRRGRGTYAVDKPPILGVVERKGLVRLNPMADVATRTVLRRLFKTFNLEDVEALYTDDYPAYNALRSLSRHETVNHSLGEYARGKVHTNTVEAEFSVFRPWNATFRGYSKEKLHLYTAHYNFLRNNRHLNRTQRTLTMLIPQAPKF